VARELAAIEAELSDETLSAAAGWGAFEATKLLPRRDTDVPPPPVRSTRGTVPASPATTPSVPPPPPPAVLPPIPVAAAPRAVPGPKRSLLWVPIVAALVVVAALAGAWYRLSRPSPPVQAQAEPSPPSPSTTEPAATEPAASTETATVPSPGISTPPQQASPPGPAASAPLVRQEPGRTGTPSTGATADSSQAAARPREVAKEP